MTDTPLVVLNDDDPTREGNLTAEQYLASYTEPGTDGPCHQYPDGLIERLSAELDAKNG